MSSRQPKIHIDAYSSFVRFKTQWQVDLRHLTLLLQMSGGADANKEFMEQLRMQELYDQRNEDGSHPYTYTDPEDGTVYDWDHEKKAWFPKV